MAIGEGPESTTDEDVGIASIPADLLLPGQGPIAYPSVEAEIDDLLPLSKGQLGLVAQCLRDGITDRKAIIDAGAAANSGAVGNILVTIRALREGLIPEGAPTVARLAASSARSFLKQHRGRMSPQAAAHVARVIDQLDVAASDRQAQEREEAELQDRGGELEETLATEGGCYVYTFPHYWRYPTVEGTDRTLLKVGMTTKNANVRVRQQARQTGVPEDPLLLRVYQHPAKSPRELEKDFHDLLDAAGHSRSSTQTGGKEWFETSTSFLDVVADKLGASINTAETEGFDS